MLRALLLASLTLLAACGAGVVSGVLASKRRQGATEVRTVALDVPSIAYFGQQGEQRQVTITGYEAPATGRLTVAIRVPTSTAGSAPFAEFDQPNAQVASVRDKLTRLVFLVNSIPVTNALLAMGRDLTAEDVSAQVIVRIDDVEVVPPIPLTIYKLMQASVQFSQQGSDTELLSAVGGSQLACRVRGYPTQGGGSFAFDFATFDPNTRGQFLTQRISNVRATPIAGSDQMLLEATTPSNAFPCRVFAAVRHSLAGQSLPLSQIYYRPEVGFAVPRAASTDGGSRVLAVGSALVALSYPEAEGPALPNYDRVELLVEKGGRRARVEPGLIQRQPASLTRLSFELPPAPDGQRGVATLILRVDLRDGVGGAIVESRAPDLISYGDGAPTFGPRGVVLPVQPEHVAFGDIEGDGGGVDAVACSGNQPNVSLFAANDNGMLHRFGPPWIAGSNSALLERRPRRLVVEDVDRNGTVDVLVINRGNESNATHTLLLGQTLPSAPLLVAGAAVPSAASAHTVAKGDFDGNGLVDVLVLPLTNLAVPPEIVLVYGTPAGGPRFVVNPLGQVTESFEVAEVADFDQDGALDIALARGGTDMALQTLYGRGDGTFATGDYLALTRQIEGYIEHGSSFASGLFACGDRTLRGLALVLTGRPSEATPATIAVLDYVGARRHNLPRPVRVLRNSSENFVRALAADLDADGVRELVVAGQQTTSEATLRVFAWSSTSVEPGFVERSGVVEAGAEPLAAVRELAFGQTAVVGGANPVPALFVAHLYPFSFEERITTFLVDRDATGVRLLAPDASQRLSFPVQGIALGRFRGSNTPAAAVDIALASPRQVEPRGLQFLSNDGLGTCRPMASVSVGLLPTTIRTLPRQDADAVVALDLDRTLRVVQPATPNPIVLSESLDPYLPAFVHSLEVDAKSRVTVADIDGDGFADVVLLLLFQTGVVPAEDRGQLLILFGRAAPPTELPFVRPDPAVVRAASVHGEARDLVVAEFATNPRVNKMLEVAISVGGAPSHVRFYRVDQPNEVPSRRALRRSFLSTSEPALIAGDDPDKMTTADVDGDGLIELAVVSRGDERLRLFNSTALVSEEVDVGSFRAIAGATLTLAPNLRQLILRDITGDGLPDLVVANENTVTGNLHTTVQHYVGNGTGGFTNKVQLADLRTGDQLWRRGNIAARNAVLSFAVGELNGDTSPDMVIGWASQSPTDANLILLFGGAR